MRDPKASSRPFILSAIAISVLAFGAWCAWIAHQPPCGPPGNTELAQTDRWAPFAFIAGEFVAIWILGLVRKRSLLTIAVTLATVGGLAILCGAVIEFVTAARAGCFS